MCLNYGLKFCDKDGPIIVSYHRKKHYPRKISSRHFPNVKIFSVLAHFAKAGQNHGQKIPSCRFSSLDQNRYFVACPIGHQKKKNEIENPP